MGERIGKPLTEEVGQPRILPAVKRIPLPEAQPIPVKTPVPEEVTVPASYGALDRRCVQAL